MHVFISRALSKIYREAPKKHAQLRSACNEVIGAPSARTHPRCAPCAEPRPRRADELKKNGAESFPAPEMDAPTPPLTPATPADKADGNRCARLPGLCLALLGAPPAQRPRRGSSW